MAKKQEMPDERIARAEREIKAKQKEVKYDIKDFTVDYIIQEFWDGLFFIPRYQREFVWDPERQSRFIESVILGLPIPMMFVAQLDDGRLEIVDGAQRIRTLDEFKSGELKLRGLKELPSLEGFFYDDLPVPQRRKYGTKAMRIVVLEEGTKPETRLEIFHRVNTSGLSARAMEVRRGAFKGRFMDFVRKCADDKVFLKLCPISPGLLKHRENEELVLRFFAYSDRYLQFQHDVDSFLDDYAEDNQKGFDRAEKEKEFRRMLKFVEANFPNGFAKSPRSKATPRVRFEAISVGVNLALRKKPDLVPRHPPSRWLESEEFKTHTTTHASNSGPRLRSRIEFVRDALLGETT